MAELSDFTKALVVSITDWLEKYGKDVSVFDEAVTCASVCTALDDEATDLAMAARPASTRGGWKRSTDTHFLGGDTNPRPCDTDPDTRRHVLYEA